MTGMFRHHENMRETVIYRSEQHTCRAQRLGRQERHEPLNVNEKIP